MIVDLDATHNLQQSVETSWAEGVRSFELSGTYRPSESTYALLRIGRHLSGIVLNGSGVLDGAGVTSHIVVVEGAKADLQGLEIRGGDTTDPAKVARDYKGPPRRSVYEAIDGAGVLVLGNSFVRLQDCLIADNYSGMCGGGLSNQARGTIEVEACRFERNTAYHTGSAIDALTPWSTTLVRSSVFTDNVSNQRRLSGRTHGQITMFKHTEAWVYDSSFTGDTYPIDAPQDAVVHSFANTYNGTACKPRLPEGTSDLSDRLAYTAWLAAYSLRMVRFGLFPWPRQ